MSASIDVMCETIARVWEGPDELGDFHLVAAGARLATAKPIGLWRTENGGHWGMEKDLEIAKIAATAAMDMMDMAEDSGQ